MIERKKKKKKKKEISRENRDSTRTISTEKERFRPVVPNSIALERVGVYCPTGTHLYSRFFGVIDFNFAPANYRIGLRSTH